MTYLNLGTLQRIRKAFTYALLALALFTSNIIAQPVAMAAAASVTVLNFAPGNERRHADRNAHADADRRGDDTYSHAGPTST